jgi:phage tail protein X
LCQNVVFGTEKLTVTEGVSKANAGEIAAKALFPDGRLIALPAAS